MLQMIHFDYKMNMKNKQKKNILRAISLWSHCHHTDKKYV